MAVFWFLLISLVVVIAAITLAVVGSLDGDARTDAVSGGLAEASPDRLHEPLPASRAVGRADVDGLRLPIAARGYRMQEVDDVLDRLGAELAERDARIAELESTLAGGQAVAYGRGGRFDKAPGEGEAAGLQDAPERRDAR
ncbi:hypothetical protein N566_03745 [Streptomycetaceae bacterium MP113-05]|nr:hypothetical protein N566_03745 [Streptomycetaceae bacterium MP113-05]